MNWDDVIEEGGDIYIEKIIHEFIQSEEMQEYLISNQDKLQCYHIIEIICSAPIGLKRKVEVLEKLYIEVEDMDKKLYEDTIHAGELALQELQIKQGELFILYGEYSHDDVHDTFETIPFYSIEKVMQYVQKETVDSQENADDEYFYWYSLEKWVPDQDGNLEQMICYDIINGEICYFFTINDRVFGNYVDLNLPVPYKAGDIVNVDCRPYHAPRNVLITEVGDNKDCCCLQGMYVTKQNRLNYGAIKHNSIFSDSENAPFIRIPALHRIQKVNDKLDEREQCLQEISDWINGEEEKGQSLLDLLRQCSEWDWGYEIDTVKKFIGGREQ